MTVVRTRRYGDSAEFGAFRAYIFGAQAADVNGPSLRNHAGAYPGEVLRPVLLTRSSG